MTGLLSMGNDSGKRYSAMTPAGFNMEKICGIERQ